jgi:hypothetical protein
MTAGPRRAMPGGRSARRTFPTIPRSRGPCRLGSDARQTTQGRVMKELHAGNRRARRHRRGAAAWRRRGADQGAVHPDQIAEARADHHGAFREPPPTRSRIFRARRRPKGRSTLQRRVWNLLAKGEVFSEMAAHPVLMADRCGFPRHGVHHGLHRRQPHPAGRTGAGAACRLSLLGFPRAADASGRAQRLASR